MIYRMRMDGLAVIAESELQLSSILDNAADAIVSFYRDGKIRSVNKAAIELFGFNEQEIFELHVTDLIPTQMNNQARAGASKQTIPS